jgi:peptide deformylase
MAKKKVLTVPDERLKIVSQPVEEITPEVKQIIRDLLDTLRKNERPGVGLAAPQIGKNLRIIVLETDGYQRENGDLVDVIPRTVLINPVIKKYSNEKVEIEEGCLSVPNLLGPVTRPKKIRVEATDENGKKICINTAGFLARVLQHEIDHLNGILFIDLVEDKSRLIKIDEKIEEL